jgi:hypothetical protein
MFVYGFVKTEDTIQHEYCDMAQTTLVQWQKEIFSKIMSWSCFPNILYKYFFAWDLPAQLIGCLHMKIALTVKTWWTGMIMTKYLQDTCLGCDVFALNKQQLTSGVDACRCAPKTDSSSSYGNTTRHHKLQTFHLEGASITNTSTNTFMSIYLWLYSSLLDLHRFFGVLIFYTVGRTPWTGDRSFARPLPKHRTTRTQNKLTQYRHPCLDWDSNPWSQCLSGRTQFMP